jgi:hypothetical protein
MLVVIDHQETRVYHAEFRDAVPSQLHPYDPRGELRHLHHTKGQFRGQRAPEDPSYYERLAALLRDADEILIFGNGKGNSSAMVQLIRYLSKHHEEIAERIVGAVTVDVEALSDNQLLAEAREFYHHYNAQG